MSKHTPGPWKIIPPDAFKMDGYDTPVHPSCVGVDNDNHSFGVNRLCSLPNNPADARLIAAAPEMLEALKDALELIREYMPEFPSRDFNQRELAISKVIKKAEST